MLSRRYLYKGATYRRELVARHKNSETGEVGDHISSRTFLLRKLAESKGQKGALGIT
jgi:hypothetical protein